MASAREWAEGYLAQARADLSGAQAALNADPSVLAMLLQMVFEKVAKAALLRAGAIDVAFATSSHASASRMVRAMKLQRGLIAPLGGPRVWDDVLELIESLERAHPDLARHAAGTPQLEYPWEMPDGTIGCPSRDLPVARALGGPRTTFAIRVPRFIALLDRHFDQIFP